MDCSKTGNYAQPEVRNCLIPSTYTQEEITPLLSQSAPATKWTFGHCADQFAAPIAGQWEAVGDCHWVAPQSHMTHPHLQVSFHYQKGVRYCPAWAAAHTQPSQGGCPGGDLYPIWTSCQGHLAHHIVQGGLKVHMC